MNTQYIVMVSLATGTADSVHFFGPFTDVRRAFDFSKPVGGVVMTLREGTPGARDKAANEFKEYGHRHD